MNQSIKEGVTTLNYYSTLTPEELKKIINTQVLTTSNSDDIVIYTGQRGNYNFQTEMLIAPPLTRKELEDKFRELRNEQYDLKEQLNYLNNLWIIKVLKKLKLIK